MERKGNASYRCVNPTQLAVVLVNDHAYRYAEPRSIHEHTRCTKGNSLIVIYTNGTVLLQGADTESPRPLLDSFQATADTQAEVPF